MSLHLKKRTEDWRGLITAKEFFSLTPDEIVRLDELIAEEPLERENTDDCKDLLARWLSNLWAFEKKLSDAELLKFRKKFHLEQEIAKPYCTLVPAL